MEHLDFAECAARAYRYVWSKRVTLLRMALIPLVIKAICLTVIVGFQLEGNYLRQGLVLLPSYFAEGWIVARVIRMAAFGEDMPAQLSGNPAKDMHLFEHHMRFVMASTIIYVLTQMCLSFFASMFISQAQLHTPEQTPAPEFQSLFIGMVIFGIMIWAFRFLWLYVPAALEFSVESFLIKLRGFRSSFYLIAIWLLCFVPMAVVLLVCLQLIGGLVGDVDAALYTYAAVLVQACTDFMTALLCSVAMAFAVQNIYNGKS